MSRPARLMISALRTTSIARRKTEVQGTTLSISTLNGVDLKTKRRLRYSEDILTFYAMPISEEK